MRIRTALLAALAVLAVVARQPSAASPAAQSAPPPAPIVVPAAAPPLAAAASRDPPTLHILRRRESRNGAWGKYAYFLNYGCHLSKYFSAHYGVPEPQRSERSQAYAKDHAAPASSYAAADGSEIEEFFAPGHYARYERTTTFEAAPGTDCKLTTVSRTTVQIAQGSVVVNAITKNGKTTVTESPLHGVPVTVTPTAAGYLPGTVVLGTHEEVADTTCDWVTSESPVAGIPVKFCVWRTLKIYPTPLGPKEIVLSSTTDAPPGAPSDSMKEPVELDLADTFRWTERAQKFETQVTIPDSVFVAPKASP